MGNDIGELQARRIACRVPVCNQCHIIAERYRTANCGIDTIFRLATANNQMRYRQLMQPVLKLRFME